MASILGVDKAFWHTFRTVLYQMGSHHHNDFSTTGWRCFQLQSVFSSFKQSLSLNAHVPCSHGSPSLSYIGFQLLDVGRIIHSSLPSQKTECAAIRLPRMGHSCHLQHHSQLIPYHHAVVSTSDRTRRRRRHILVCDVRGHWDFNVSKHCSIEYPILC